MKPIEDMVREEVVTELDARGARPVLRDVDVACTPCGCARGAADVGSSDPDYIHELRADLARVTAERDDARDQVREVIAGVEAALVRNATLPEDERDALRAQVRALLPVARAAVGLIQSRPHCYGECSSITFALEPLDEAVAALPPSALEGPSDG